MFTNGSHFIPTNTDPYLLTYLLTYTNHVYIILYKVNNNNNNNNNPLGNSYLILVKKRGGSTSNEQE